MTEISRGSEAFVCRWLSERGWRILERNFRTRRSEVDIIASRNGMLAFVEVKYASDRSTTPALEKVDREKVSRIVHGASVYLSGRNVTGQVRFDVAIVGGTAGSFRMDLYLEDAFRPDLQ